MRSTKLFSLAGTVVLVLAACTTSTPAPEIIIETVEVQVPGDTVVETVEVQVEITPVLTPVRVSLGYIPNFQFAPFYVALEKGFFLEEGLNIIMDYGTETDAVTTVAQGVDSFGIASGDSVILARSNGVPIKHVMRWYNGWPTSIFSLAESGITSPEDLVGKTVGLPGPFGANWMAWLALLHATGVNPDDVTVEMIGFTQMTAVSEGLVDAAGGYTVNEPVQLRSQGLEINEILLDDYIDLAPIGIFASEQFIADNPDIVQAFVDGMIRGINEAVADPDFTLEAVIRAVQFSDRAGTQAGLEAVFPYWSSPGGFDVATYEDNQTLMVELGMITTTTSPEEMFTNEFVE
jgi:NitT/TauT family transport system substrate-binding protein